MLIKFERFNIYLCLLLGLALAAGCESDSDKKKDFAAVELHLEVNPDGATDNEAVSVLRAHPMKINVDKQAFLDTADIESAGVVDDMGGFKLKLKFNWRGTQILSGETTANIGKRIGIYCVFGENRWIAAPLITKGITDGVYTFTPDVSREEADRIVKGLNAVAAEVKKSDKL